MRNDYLKHIRETGKQEEYIAFMYAIGAKPAEIAKLFGITRQSVYNNVTAYKAKLKLKGEESQYYERDGKSN